MLLVGLGRGRHHAQAVALAARRGVRKTLPVAADGQTGHLRGERLAPVLHEVVPLEVPVRGSRGGSPVMPERPLNRPRQQQDLVLQSDEHFVTGFGDGHLEDSALDTFDVDPDRRSDCWVCRRICSGASRRCTVGPLAVVILLWSWLRSHHERRRHISLQRDQVGPGATGEAEVEEQAVIYRVKGPPGEEVEVFAGRVERRADVAEKGFGHFDRSVAAQVGQLDLRGFPPGRKAVSDPLAVRRPGRPRRSAEGGLVEHP